MQQQQKIKSNKLFKVEACLCIPLGLTLRNLYDRSNNEKQNHSNHFFIVVMFVDIDVRRRRPLICHHDQRRSQFSDVFGFRRFCNVFEFRRF